MDYIDKEDIFEILENGSLQDLKDYFYDLRCDYNFEDINNELFNNNNSDFLIEALYYDDLDKIKYIVEQFYTFTKLDYSKCIRKINVDMEDVYNEWCSPLSSTYNSEIKKYLINHGATQRKNSYSLRNETINIHFLNDYFKYRNRDEDIKYSHIYKQLRNIEEILNKDNIDYKELLEKIKNKIGEFSDDDYDKFFLNSFKKIPLNKEKEAMIIQLINKNDLSELKKYIEENNIKFTTIQGEYSDLGLDSTKALNCAIRNRNKPIFDYFIDIGANPKE
eukprot:jgi/Orpsp1_1/1175379/evm.model.c7180000053631.1